MMCGQCSKALLKKGLVTPTIMAGLSSRRDVAREGKGGTSCSYIISTNTINI